MVEHRVVVGWTRQTPTVELVMKLCGVVADYIAVKQIVDHAGPEEGPSLGIYWIIQDDLDEIRAIEAELRHRGERVVEFKP